MRESVCVRAYACVCACACACVRVRVRVIVQRVQMLVVVLLLLVFILSCIVGLVYDKERRSGREPPMHMRDFVYLLTK